MNLRLFPPFVSVFILVCNVAVAQKPTSDSHELTVLTNEPGRQLQRLLMREFDEHDARKLEAFAVEPGRSNTSRNATATG